MLANATVSHELRNPLNSLVAQNMEKSALYKELREVVSSGEINDQPMWRITDILDKLEKGSKI
jgi:signal transduction histidine kinase